MLEFSIATITVFVGAINELVKFFFTNYSNIDIKKYIPIVSICTGLMLGIIGYLIPEVQMGSNIVEAIFIGIASGAAATGVHQVGKQITKPNATTDTAITDIPEEENIPMDNNEDEGQ